MLGLGVGLGASIARPAAFNPAALFASGAAGMVLDPSDAGTLFQDAQGQLPVLGPGDPVGLVLGASQGVKVKSLEDSLGPELVYNGDFASAGGWRTTLSDISGGALNVADADANEHISNSGGVPADHTKDNLIVVNLENIDANFGVRIGIYTPSGLPLIGVSSGIYLKDSGSYGFFVPAGTTTQDWVVGFFRYSGHTGSLRVLRASVREVQSLSERSTGLGPELFRDPAFATDFSGTLANIGTTLSIGGGELTVINNNTYAGRWTDRSIPLAPHKAYLVEFGVSEFLGGSASVQLRTGDVNLNHNPTSGATSEIYSGLGLGEHAIVVANTSGATIDRYIGTYVGEGSGAYGHKLSYFSIREIPGNHVVQPLNDDYRPTLAQDARGVNYLQLDGIDDFLTATLPDLGSDVSEWWADEAGVVISTGETIGAGARNLPGVSKLYSYGLLNRALTTSETAQLTTYLNQKRGA